MVPPTSKGLAGAVGEGPGVGVMAVTSMLCTSTMGVGRRVAAAAVAKRGCVAVGAGWLLFCVSK